VIEFVLDFTTGFNADTHTFGEHCLGLLFIHVCVADFFVRYVFQIYILPCNRNTGVAYLHSCLNLKTLIFSDRIPRDDVAGVYVQIL
jgi:hypothetical protein